MRKNKPWSTIGIGDKYSDITAENGDQDTEQCDWCKLADKFDADKNADEHEHFCMLLY